MSRSYSVQYTCGHGGFTVHVESGHPEIDVSSMYRGLICDQCKEEGWGAITVAPYRPPKEIAIRAMCELVIKVELEKGFFGPPIPKDYPWRLVDPEDYGAGLIRSWGYPNDSGAVIPHADLKAVMDRVCDVVDEYPACYTLRMEVIVYDNGRPVYYRGLNVMGHCSLYNAIDIWRYFRSILLPEYEREGFIDYCMQRGYKSD